MSAWANLSARHVHEAVMEWADALDAAAGYIVAQKAEAIAELEGIGRGLLRRPGGGGGDSGASLARVVHPDHPSRWRWFSHTSSAASAPGCR
jgi:hypothetical protein